MKNHVFRRPPVSYAQMGLLPQVLRSEGDLYSNLKQLLEASGRSVPVPDWYLRAT
jgi:hypothetical protein